MQKRNNERVIITLNKKAKAKFDSVPKGKRSKFVSTAIEHFTPVPNGDGGFCEKKK